MIIHNIYKTFITAQNVYVNVCVKKQGLGLYLLRCGDGFTKKKKKKACV